MIKLYIYVSSFFILLSCNVKTKQIDNQNTNIDTTQIVDTLSQNNSLDIKNLSRSFVQEGKWVQIKNALSSEQTGMYLYFESEHGVAKNLRLRIQYGNSSSFRFKVGGKTYSYKANRSQDSNTAFVDGGVCWYDDSVKKDDLKFIEALIKSDNATLVLNGETSIAITNKIKSDMQKTLDYFEAQDGLLPKSNMVNIRRL